MGIEDFKDTQPKFLPYSGTEPVLEGRALGE